MGFVVCETELQNDHRFVAQAGGYRDIKEVHDVPKTFKTYISIRRVNLNTASLVAQVSSQDIHTILHILASDAPARLGA